MINFEREPSIKDGTDEEIFQNYMEDLRFAPDDFDKKILDVGAGSAKFAKWAKEHGVSKEIYSLDPVKENLAEKEKSVVAISEALPFKDESFDLIISNAAIPNMHIGNDLETVRGKVFNSLNEMVRVVKSGGEIRLGRVLIGKKYSPQRNLSSSIQEVLDTLNKKSGCQINKIRMPYADTYENDRRTGSRELLAEAYLIIILKKKK
ncbi:MAG: class I SAM-dependent methyltransferase [bacterium]|nr:class I SAM-dependent methyltransferase [bacterium]